MPVIVVLPICGIIRPCLCIWGLQNSLYQFLAFASDLEKAFNVRAQFDKGSFVLLVLTFYLMFLHCEFDSSVWYSNWNGKSCLFRAKYLILSAFTCPETSVPFHLFRTLGLSDINENETWNSALTKTKLRAAAVSWEGQAQQILSLLAVPIGTDGERNLSQGCFSHLDF